MTTPTPTPATLAVDILATQRLTRLLTEDTITQPLRNAVWRFSPPENPHGPGYVFTCPHCAGIWAAFAITATHTRAFRLLRPLAYSLALADITSLVAEYVADNDGWG